MPTYTAGLDLGQSSDYTALTIIEHAHTRPDDEATDGRAYHLRHAHRYELGTPYPEIVRDVDRLLGRAPLQGSTTLVVDRTGVGAPVVDLFTEAGLSPKSVTITGGENANRDGDHYTVPKRELASVVQALLQTGRLRFAQALPHAAALREELQKFRAKINISTGSATFEHWRERDTDDLVLALAMACWYADRAPRPNIVWV